MAEPDIALAERKATLSQALDMSSLAVIGLIIGHNGPAALLRNSDGQIMRVMAGEVAFGVTITAIGDNQILATDGSGRTQSLTLPHG